MTIFDKLVIALKARGYRIDPRSRSVKRTEMIRSGDEFKLFIGRKGSLRRGYNIKASLPVSEAFRRQLLGE